MSFLKKKFIKKKNVMAWSYGRDGKIWQNMGKKCGKSWKDMLK